jgi:hypothetical protein
MVHRRGKAAYWHDRLNSAAATGVPLDRALTKYVDLTVERVDLGMLAGPRHRDEPGFRWMTYKEAFSPRLVREILDGWSAIEGPLLDPFAGTGTSILVANERDLTAYGVELLAYPQWAAQTIISARSADDDRLRRIAADTVEKSRRRRSSAHPVLAAPAAGWALSSEVADTLLQLRSALPGRGTSTEADLAHLALVSIVEAVSASVKDGTSLRHRQRQREGRSTRPGRKGHQSSRADVLRAFMSAASSIADDIPKLPSNEAVGTIVRADARRLPYDEETFGCAIFSPPYPNRYDYSAIYQLELAVGGFVQSSDELKSVRRSLLRSHLEAPPPVAPELGNHLVVSVLAAVAKAALAWCGDTGRTLQMLIGYFDDMMQVLKEVARVLRPGAPAACVVSTQTYFGVAVPTDVMLGSLAEQAGMAVEGLWVLRHKRVAVQQRSRGGMSSPGGREAVLLLRKPL